MHLFHAHKHHTAMLAPEEAVWSKHTEDVDRYTSPGTRYIYLQQLKKVIEMFHRIRRTQSSLFGLKNIDSETNCTQTRV